MQLRNRDKSNYSSSSSVAAALVHHAARSSVKLRLDYFFTVGSFVVWSPCCPVDALAVFIALLNALIERL